MKIAKRGDRLQVHVDRLSVGGRGVARHEGLVIFVHDVAPNEDVEVEITFVKKNFAEARLVHVVKPSAMRVTPPCPVAGICGGCSWQHVAYEEQLRQKQSLVAESMRKFSGYTEVQVEATVASPNEFRYRNRIQLHHSGPRIGFYKRGSHEIVDIDDCPITEEAVASQILRLKTELANQRAGRIELLRSSDGSIGTRGSSSSDSEEVDAATTTGPAFAQVNTAQNEKLVADVIARVKALAPAKNIFDLYAGSGNFSFPLSKAQTQARVTAVEFNHESVVRGRALAASKQDSTTHVEFVEGDVAKYLVAHPLPPDSIVVLDPPRAGCGLEVMTELARAKPRDVIYISCHPVTLARDLRALQEVGYSLVSVRPFDMFPQTDHVETVAQLTFTS